MSRITIALTAAAAGLLLAACSSAPAVTSGNNTPAALASTPAASPSASTSSPAVTAGQLSGKWKGQYSGSYTGTFKLHWHQSGTHLAGKIKISNPAQTMPITGTVKHGKISFGTVGSLAITYTGSVSGGSMSGQYQVHDGRSDGGPWQASKA